MKIALQGELLSISGMEELGPAHSKTLREQLHRELPASTVQAIEIDLSGIQSLDSSGIGALTALQRWFTRQNGNKAVRVRLLYPLPPVQQMLEFTRLHHTFEIVKR